MLSFFTLVLCSLLSLVRAYPNPVGCSGDCYAHDPFVIQRYDGTYFRFSTDPGIGIWTAESLLGPWTDVGRVIAGESIITTVSDDTLWAPDVSYIRGVYYLFYALSTSGSQTSAIGYATSSTMEPGSWTDRGAVVESSSSTPYNAIDPNLVNGTGADEFYLTWGSYWSDIYQARLAIDGNFIFASGNTEQIAYDPNNNHDTEGSTIYYHGGYYWLFLSRGVCCTYTPTPTAGTEYHVVVCQSSNPNGPFVDESGASCLTGGGTTILASHDEVYAPGGQGVFTDPVYGDVMYYHYLNTSIGVAYAEAKFGFNQISWGSNGWPTLV
ncbi:glycoside hydrolase, family 43 [Xylariales sp. PMI_506]|nr:glycoside hydrolase, family 43 [Xylariales sp. PMI_506]